MSSMIEKSSSIMKLIYEIKEEKEIKTLAHNFNIMNKRKCIMIINNKIYPLINIYKIYNNNMKILKVKLIIMNNKGLNFSHMFSECKSLQKFYLTSKEEIMLEKKETNKEENISSIDSCDEYNTQIDLKQKSKKIKIKKKINFPYTKINYILFIVF